MTQDFGHGTEDARIAVLEEKQKRIDERLNAFKEDFDKRCEKKEADIKDMLAYQNRAIGILVFASFIAGIAAQYFMGK